MFNRSDPRFRRRLNQISQNFESANESAQVGLFSFSQFYIKPCFGSIVNCVQSCTAPCFPSKENRQRRKGGGVSRSQPEFSFDFYDDWEDDENDALLAWGNDDYDEQNERGDRGQPTPHNTMNYGSNSDGKLPRTRGKGTVLPCDDVADPTAIPKSSVFGFMERLPFRVGPRALRYKPSAADLKDRSHGKKRVGAKVDVLEEESHDEEEAQPFQGGRKRSTTVTSSHSIESLSSRGDIFPSDDEDDAVPLDDEFALGLERRNTEEDTSSGKTRSGKKSTDSSRMTSRTHSSRSLRRQNSGKSQAEVLQRTTSSLEAVLVVSSLEDLKDEEHKLQREEEAEIEKRREAAQKLARERGLSVSEGDETAMVDVSSEFKVDELNVSPTEMSEYDPTNTAEPQAGDIPSTASLPAEGLSPEIPPGEASPKS